MSAPHDPNVTADIPDSLDAGLAAGFGRPVVPRSGLGDTPPILLKEAEGESEHIVKPNSDALPPKEDAGDRYQLSGEIARGGMGAVLRGRDVDLGRDLAIKVLLEKYADRPDVARRFVEEAQIGGQLQHPGVVPVYDIGRFGDRPFFTMKLVKGRTLAAILEGRASATADRPQLLGIALKVCETLAYAHAKGVIHRDLKPANIMVGAFGEVQVMDWGLAKVLAEGGVADEERAGRAHQEPDDVTTIRTARSSGTGFGTDTEAGSLLGTPAYMPPEQANGDIALLDRRADVFGLGAVLCEILTGKPPYTGRSGEEVRRKAANGDLADALSRLDACGADAELIALTKSCLAAEAIDRPRDAQEVTNGLSAYLNGVQERVQAAERERAVAVAREAEQRKRRKVQLALGVALLALVAGGGGVGWWLTEQANERRLADERAATELARLEGQQQAERAERQLETAQRQAADAGRLARNGEAVAALLTQAEVALKAGDTAKAELAWDAARKRSADGGAEVHAARLKLLRADLRASQQLDIVDQYRWTWSANRFPPQSVVAFRTWAALYNFGSPLSESYEEAAAWVSGSTVRERLVAGLHRLLEFERDPSFPSRGYANEILRRVDADSYRDAVRDALLANDTKKIVDLVNQKAALEQPAGFVAALAFRQEIPVERRRQMLQTAVNREPGNFNLLMTLAQIYGLRSDPGLDPTVSGIERVRWYQAAVAAVPNNFAANTNLADELILRGDYDGGATYARRAIAIDPKNAVAHTNLGAALRAKGEQKAAIASYRKAVELDDKNAVLHNNLGIVLHQTGDPRTAADCFRKAIDLDPNHARAHYSLGVALRDLNDADGALKHWRKATEVDPNFAPAYTNLGAAFNARGLHDDAIACYRKAIKLEPTNANAHHNYGNAMRDKGDLDGAAACYQKAIECDPKHAPAHYGMAYVRYHKDDLDGAVTYWKRTVELDQKDTLARTYLAKAERMASARGKLPDFLSGKYSPATNSDRVGLADLCIKKKLYHAAARLYADALAAGPKLADTGRTLSRYDAACSAALAAAGKGEDAGKLDDAERTRLRTQSLEWLKADLTDWAKRVETGKPADRDEAKVHLRHWQKDSDLTSVRDKEALAKLPVDEQKAFAQFWEDVATLLKKTEANRNSAAPSATPPALAPPPRETK